MTKIQLLLARKNYAIAAAVVVAMLIWIVSGLFVQRQQSDSAAVKLPAELTKVVAAYSEANEFTQVLKVRGRTEAKRKVNVRAEIRGVVAAVPVNEGARVEGGDVICELAIEDRQLLLNEAIAAEEKAKLDYDGALRLKSSGYQSRTAIAAAKSMLNSAVSNRHRRNLDVENLTIRAPFAGIVHSRSVEMGDLMERGDTCATVLDVNPLVVTGQVAETDVDRLSPGASAEVSLLTGQKAAGVVRFIGHESDPITRTFRVEVEVENTDWTIRSGITADVSINAGHYKAHRISPALLLLDDNGVVGVRIVDTEQRVHFQAVTIIGGDDRGAWVQGLSDKVMMITVGQLFVSDGQRVDVSIDSGKPEENVPPVIDAVSLAP